MGKEGSEDGVVAMNEAVSGGAGLRRSASQPVGRSGARQGGFPVLAAILFATVFLPISLEFGPLTLPPIRIFLLAVSVPLAFLLLSGRIGRIHYVDVAFIGFSLWMLVCVGINNPSRVIEFGGSNILEFLVSYLVGRAAVRTPEDFKRFCKFLVIAIAISVPLAVYEGMTATVLTKQVIEGMGFESLSVYFAEPRWGIDRAQVVFSSPIHYGFFASLGFAIAFVGLKANMSTALSLFLAALCFVGVFFSLSSGAVLPIFMQLCLIMYGWMFRGVKRRWTLLIFFAVPIYSILEVLSDRPAYLAILSRIAFNTGNVYIRTVMLEFGMIDVRSNPIFGIGLRDWTKPAWLWYQASIDNYWLVTAMRYGIVGFFLHFSGFLYLLIQVGRRDFSADPKLAALRLAWVLTMVGATITLVTVHIWGSIFVIFLLMCGSAVWMLDYTPETDEPAEEAEEPQTKASRYSRYAPTKERQPTTPSAPAPRRHQQAYRT